VTVSNVAPSASLSGSSSGDEGEALAWACATSDPGAKDTVSVTWDFGDGSSGAGSSVSHACCEYALHELLDPGSEVYGCGADLTVLSVHADELVPELFRTRTLLGPLQERQALCDRAASALLQQVERLVEGTRGPVLVLDLEVPARSPLGIQDGAVPLGLRACIRRLNGTLEDALRSEGRVSVVARSALPARLEAPSTDPKLRYLAGQRESRAMLGAIADELARHVHALTGRTRKVLVLDLDNTVWGGVLGEEGLGGLRLDVAGPGRAYRDFQQACLDLHDRGVVLAVASKNDHDLAVEALRDHPHALLRPEHFSALQIHWEDKATSCRRIAEELNVGLDSLVFFDDNPVEREWVAAACPEVEVVDVPRDAARYTEALVGLRAFETATLSAEDARRSELYRQERVRAGLASQATSLADYLEALDTRLRLGALDAYTAPRIAQLVHKTNQLNMTTIRRSQGELEALAASPDHEVLWAAVEDRFGDAGVVGVAVVACSEHTWRLDTFLLSCRVLKRGVEAAFVRALCELAVAQGIRHLEARWVRTRKNASNRHLFRDVGLTALREEEDEGVYALDLDQGLPPAPFVTFDLRAFDRRGAA